MAGKIKLLPEYVANQIAAGEVVNRPSSVVKEMMENAVDAGAKNITVNFRDGGKTLIQVVDDGVGMSPADARLAFDRHATSKINDVEDIYALQTFGFRGEALASIASVAEVELRTRQEEDELGTKVEISGGKFIGQAPVSCPVGSQFIVKNLFYNVPARRRFIDKSSTEARHITAEYQRVALVNPGIGFSLYDNDSLISKLPPSGLRQRVVGVIGKNIAKNLLDVSADTSIVKIEGFVGRPASAKQNNREQFMFVNGRYFKHPYFHKAVVSAYEKLIQSGTQPSYFLYFTIDPARIDVNVHPQKTEVKFEDGADMWQIISASVRESLARAGAVPAMDFDIDASVEIPVFRDRTTYKAPEIRSNPDFNPFERYPDAGESGGSVSTARAAERDYAHEDDFVSIESSFEDDYEASVLEFINGGGEHPRLDIGDIAGKSSILLLGTRYAVMVAERGLTVIDIRRAYESVLFDRYMVMLGNGSSVSQQLLFPERIILSGDDLSLMQEHLDDFTAFGFDIRIGGELSAEVYGIPADLVSSAPEELIYELLDTLRDDQSGDDIKRRRIATAMARAGAASRTRRMAQEELEALMESLGESSNASYTPSGKQVMTVLTEEEIAKRLK